MAPEGTTRNGLIERASAHLPGGKLQLPKSRAGKILALAVAILLLAILATLLAHFVAERRLAGATRAAAVPYVNVIAPKPDAPTEKLMLPGTVEAFIDTPLYARINGYLKRWYFDIGATVKQGDLLAEIDAPEVDAQLQQARADLATAQANLKLADVTAQRNESLLKSRSVSTQDRDNAVGAFGAAKATVQSRQATVDQLTQTQSFEKIYAPFGGIVTARNVDIGTLVDSGAGSANRELFHLTAIKTLRLYVAVPEVDAPFAKPGTAATVTLDEFPGQTFHGTLVRTTNAIDPGTRTLRTEIDVDNPDGRILPGAYAFAHLELPAQTGSVTVPANTLLFRSEGLRVAVVRDGKAELVPIKIGHDYGGSVEVVSGLSATDQVILDPSDSLLSDTPVRISGSPSAGTAP